jgi:sulfur relay protein TusB/DsrH
MALHTINLNPSSTKLTDVFAQLALQDSVIFLNASLPLLESGTSFNDTLAALKHKQISWFALHDSEQKKDFHPDITVINYSVFVKLAVENKKILSWY